MAGRRYVRDNRGRFASTGATARGGRLATASGNKRKTVKASPGIADRMSSAPRGTIGGTRSARFSQHVDRPLDKRPAYKQGFVDQKAAIASRKGPKAASKSAAPAKGSAAANKIEMAKGRSAVLQKQKDSQNKQLREINAKIKEAGSSAGALRLQKLQVQSRLSETRTALSQSKAAAGNQSALKAKSKQQAQVDGLKQKVARMKRAQSRYEATADTRNQPGSKMVRRPDAKTSRGNRRAEQARSIYMGASLQKISNYAQGVARTSKAKNNWMQPRSVRVAQAKRSGNSLVTVRGYKSRK